MLLFQSDTGTGTRSEGNLKLDKENVQTHSASWQTVTYQRTITGDRNYFGHRVQEYRERKENCNA